MSFPVTRSILSVDALLSTVSADYDIGEPLECRLWVPAVNDTYIIKTDSTRYALRVYRAGQRSESDILYEMDLLTHLKRKGLSVSAPLRHRDGGYIRELKAPEGIRYSVLLSDAPGSEMTYETDETMAYLYGQSLAEIHIATGDFRSSHNRFSLDLHHLIDVPLMSIERLLSHKPADWRYLQQLANKLHKRISAIADSLDEGICHGDSNGWNAHFSADNKISFYDFDDSGWGWRVFDLANFRWGMRREEEQKERELWAEFVQGYSAMRPIKPIALDAVDLFVLVRHIKFLGTHTSNGKHWGFQYIIGGGFVEKGVKFLRTWESEIGGL